MKNIYGISKLEADILLIVWDRDRVTIREVHETFLRKETGNKKSHFALYAGILSNMNNLAKKKILKIDTTNKTHIYSVGIDKKELAKSIIGSVAEKLL
jgi:predicted transcriptional regulator